MSRVTKSITVFYDLDGGNHSIEWRWPDDAPATKRIDGVEVDGEGIEAALAHIDALKQAGAVFVPRHAQEDE